MQIRTYQKHKILTVIKNTKNNNFFTDREIAENILKGDCNIYNRYIVRKNRNLTILSPDGISFGSKYCFNTKFININDLSDGLSTFAKINGMDFHHVILFEPTTKELGLLRKESNVAIFLTISHFCVPKDEMEDFGRSLIKKYGIDYCVLRYVNEPFKMYAICKKETKIKYFEINDLKQLSFLINNDWFAHKLEIKQSSISKDICNNDYQKLLEIVEPYFLHINAFKNAEFGFVYNNDIVISMRSHIDKFMVYKNVFDIDVMKYNYVVSSKLAKDEYGSNNVFDIINFIKCAKMFINIKKVLRPYFAFIPSDKNYLACPNIIKYFHSDRIMNDIFSKEEFSGYVKQYGDIYYHEYFGYYIISKSLTELKKSLDQLTILSTVQYEPMNDKITAKTIEQLMPISRYPKKELSELFEQIPVDFSKQFIKNIKTTKMDSEVLFYGHQSFLLSELFRHQQYKCKVIVYDDYDAMTKLSRHKSSDKILLSFGKRRFDTIALFNYFDYRSLSSYQFEKFIDFLSLHLYPDGEIVFNCFDFGHEAPYVQYVFPKYAGTVERSQLKESSILKINYRNKSYFSEHTFISEDMINKLREKFDVCKNNYDNNIVVYKLKRKRAVC